MTELLLIRHAIAFERDRERWADDRQRPLTSAGAEKFRDVASGLNRLVGAPDFLLTSPFERAKQTAKILLKCSEWPEPIESPAFSPGQTATQALAVLRGYASGRVAVVGHEPNLSELLSVCVAGSEDAIDLTFKKGGVALLSFTAAPTPGKAHLNWLATPKMLRSLA